MPRGQANVAIGFKVGPLMERRVIMERRVKERAAEHGHLPAAALRVFHRRAVP